MNDKIKVEVKRNEEKMVAFRRDLHRNPELSWQEIRTTNRVVAELERIGIAYRRMEPTGVVAELVGNRNGKTVALRADMDALPVMELSEALSYRSGNDGKMHACGHDAHTAMLLCAAEALVGIQDELAGTVRFIFQPAEEITEGAEAMIQQGAMQGVDNVFGIHIWSQMPTHAISCNAGPVFASADVVEIKFTGRGGHGAMPDACIDAAVVASAFVMGVQAIVSRETDPLEPAVFTIGRMEAGTRYNVIAENAVLEGTVRSFHPRVREKMEAAIRRYAEQVAATYGATAEVDYRYGTHAVINEEQSANLAQRVVTSSFGDAVLYSDRPTTAGEDFSYYLQEAPGCFALVGAGNLEKDTEWAHHHGRFNVDEDAMVYGAELYAQYAYTYLTENPE
ncbi:peptidase M20 [Listeria newyorkensis]|uniref:Peptidase M20 n=1 Tax=Listeria newyorkensis TaxID=1497681 RepID=A0ABX4XPF6_9LIST|nr:MULTISPECIES: amidohydrolase [Listeria]KGL45137.1 peptidase M20 [Listeriaceae bacterium FSL A5-0209]KGL40032.1 peptidase M20 [Listeria newyorkensis]PNP93315.1 peptidase M20 [Listeria newyorkensis]RQW68224.1 amidohydrolase [Listeria sp. SHR_NRA_18]WAO21241.1 amidohydrolase [Listeria newyorkensis]